MAVTMKAIAERAGVSLMVVSAALHNTAGIRVSAAKRELIRRTAEEMGYRPNLLARSLSGGSSGMIGVVIDSCAPESCFKILRHIEAEAARHDYRVMIVEEHDSPGSVIAACRTFDQYRVDGIICLAHDYPGTGDELERFFADKTNVVFLERVGALPHACVEVDPKPAFLEVIRRFLAVGRPPLYLIPELPQIVIRRRIAGYRAVCEALGVEARFLHFRPAAEPVGIREEMARCLREYLLPERIGAVLVENDLCGAGLLFAASHSGVRVPEELAVIGWDNADFCTMLNPPLASIDNDYAAQGRALVELVSRVIAGKHPPAMTVASRPVWRESAFPDSNSEPRS